MLTLKQVNDALIACDIKATLYKGRGYFYFDGSDVEKAKSTTVCVYTLNQLTLDQWLDKARELKEESSCKPKVYVGFVTIHKNDDNDKLLEDDNT